MSTAKGREHLDSGVAAESPRFARYSGLRIRRPPCEGFTLIELLVVLVVIGVVVVAIQINLFSDDARRLRNEGERMAALLTALADETVTGGCPLAVSFSRNGYTFWEKDEDNKQNDAPTRYTPDPYTLKRDDSAAWRARPGDELFSSRRMQGDIQIAEVRIGQRSVSLSTKSPERVVFSPSGIHPPFSIVLALGGLRVIVVSDAIGNLRVEDDVGMDAGS
jgi:general secretion pathway protein H